MLFLSQRRDNQTLVLWLPFRSSSFRWPQVQLNLYSVSNMFGNWIQGISKDLKPLVLLGAAATYWSIWLCRNDIVFEKKKYPSPLRVIFLVIHQLHTWAILLKPDTQDLVVAASGYLAQVAKVIFFQTHGWHSILWIISHQKVCSFLFLMVASFLLGRARKNYFHGFVSIVMCLKI